jgi:hypothetical protein
MAWNEKCRSEEKVATMFISNQPELQLHVLFWRIGVAAWKPDLRFSLNLKNEKPMLRDLIASFYT